MAKRKLARATPSPKQKRQTKSRWTTWAVVGGLVVVIGALVAVLSLQGGKGSGGSKGSAHVGSPAPDFTLRLLNGESLTLSSLKGKPVLLSFWAST